MNQQHPITPPPELVRKWARFQNYEDPEALWCRIATVAARWGADEELEACCKCLTLLGCSGTAADVRALRRPKPPSLKEQALNCLVDIEHGATPCPSDFDSIRRALEALPE